MTHVREKMKHVALITGASGGIGKELAIIHAREGGDLVLEGVQMTGGRAVVASRQARVGVTQLY